MSNTTTNIVVAIDGPAASGKSTVAKTLAKKLGLIMINTGIMYRAVAWLALKNGVNPENEQAISDLLQKQPLKCSIKEGFSTVELEGLNSEEELRTEEVSGQVSAIAALPFVRTYLLEKQRDYLELGSIVMEGRDIGTVVFPETPFKFFISASEEVRSARRKAEGIEESISERDKKDSQRAIAPLVQAEDAYFIDSSDLSIEQVLDQVIEIMKKKNAPSVLFN